LADGSVPSELGHPCDIRSRRIESMVSQRALHRRYGHPQQNRADDDNQQDFD
jgi:hypothetical protein